VSLHGFVYKLIRGFKKNVLMPGILLAFFCMGVTAQNEVAFSVSKTEGCVPLTVNFSDQSTGTVTSRLWNLGNGNISNHNAQVGANFTSAGTYNITLTVTFLNGQVEELTQQVRVYEKPSSDFTYGLQQSCGPATVHFKGAANSNTTAYLWDFGDAATSVAVTPSHAYTQEGQYTVKLIATNGGACQSAFTAQLVVPKAEPAMNVQIVSAPLNACLQRTLEFKGSVNGRMENEYTTLWVFGDNNSSTTLNTIHSYHQPGTYVVKLIATSLNGICSDTAMQQLTVQPKITAAFSADKLSSCAAPLAVQFTNETTGPGNLNYQWNFGDNGTSVAVNPLHTYSSTGNSNVTLIVNDNSGEGGCRDSLTKSQYIKIGKPSANFYYAPASGCGPLNVTVTASIGNIDPANPITRYTWDWGDGSPNGITTTGSTAHTYTAPGTYPIVLTVETRNGCISTSAARYITVNHTCSDDGIISEGGAFITTRNCADKYSIAFSDTSALYTVTSWDFGDLSPTSADNPATHTFPGTQKEWMVTLTRKNNNTNVTETVTKKIVIIDEKAAFTVTNTATCTNVDIGFTTTGLNSANISRFIWDFGDGKPRRTITNNLQLGIYNNGNTNYRYTESGSYVPRLIIADKLGCLDSMVFNQQIVIKGPTVDFTATPLIACSSPVTVTFNSTSVPNPGVPITSWQWWFGDSNATLTSTQDSATHYTYAHNEDYKAYTAKLKIRDRDGCENEISKTDIVQVTNVKAMFASADTLICGQHDIIFGNGSVANTATYTWYWGDGNNTQTTSKDSITHTYISDGIYAVKLVVTPTKGCADSMVRTDYIKIVKPHAAFSIGDTTQCVPAAVGFENTSTYSLNYAWHFDNGNTYTQKNPPPQTYTSPGLHTVTLEAKGINGCTNEFTKTFRIKGPVADLTYSGNGGCTPFVFDASVSGTDISTYSWDFGDGTAINTSAADSVVSHVYTLSGTFTPSVILTSNNGCTNNLMVPQSIQSGVAEASFTVDKNKFCDEGTVNFTNTSSGGTVYTEQLWNFGDGTSFNGAQPAPKFYNKPGIYNVSLIVETDFGCRDTINADFPVTVSANPVLTITSGSDVCIGDTIHLKASVQSANYIPSMHWLYNNQIVSDTLTLDVPPGNAGALQYAFTAATAQGCADTVSTAVSVHPLPVPNASASASIVCSGSAVQLSASGGGTYQWQSDQPVDDHAAANAVGMPVKSTDYIVTVTTTYGCIQKDTVRVTTAEPVNIIATPEFRICKGDSVELDASGNTNVFIWEPSSSLSNPGVYNPVASPVITTEYLVIGHSLNVCPDDSARVNVEVLDNPTLNLGNDTAILGDVPFTLMPQVSSNVSNYAWQPVAGLSCSTCLNPVALPTNNQQYILSVSTEEGCKALDSIFITVLCNKDAIYIPTAFTPNGDQLNDKFYIKGYGLKSINYFSIFDRWGKEVFSRKNFNANDSNMGWDGNLRNSTLPHGTATYAWVAEVVCSQGFPITLRGMVTLIR
jgi:gliding motility-associated-like protein